MSSETKLTISRISEPNPTAQDDTYLGVAAEVTPLFELDETTAVEAFHDFVARRIDELSVGEQQTSVGAAKGGTDEFIRPQTEMILSELLSRPYHMDDPSAYETAFPQIRNLYKQYVEKMSPEKSYLNAVIQGANFAQAVYFGSVVGNPHKRSEVSDDIVSDDPLPETFSIADFEHGAMCQERAGVVHNTLHIFGVESSFVAGDLSVNHEDGSTNSEPHAFLVITGSEGQKYILDPTNPVVYKDEEGQIKTFTPALYKLERGSEGRQHVTLAEFTLIDGAPQQSKTQKLTYSLGKSEQATA